MSETTTEVTETETTEIATDSNVEADKWKALARKHEARAKENADKAKRLDEIEAASKTELEKATARAEAAETALALAQTERDRMSVALAKGLDAELAPLLSGVTKEEIEASADLIAKHTAASKPVKTTKPTDALKSGVSGTSGEGLTEREKAAAALRELRGASL